MKIVTACALAIVAGLTTGAVHADKVEPNEKPWSYGFGQNRDVFPEDEGVNNSCPGQAIECGDGVQPAAINPGGDEDWVEFFVTAGTLITVGTDAYNGSSTDTYLELYFGCGTGTIATNDDGGPGLFSLISNFPAPSTGLYQAKVRGYSTNTTGEYQLFVSCTDPVPPPENDQCNDEYAILRCTEGTLEGDLYWAANDYTTGTNSCTGYSANGKDVAYRMDLQAGDTVDLSYLQTGFDSSFYIITDCADSGGSCVIGADDTVTGEAEVISWDVAQSGTYWLILDTYGTDTGGAWSLTYRITCGTGTGACCIGSECRVTTEEDCRGAWQGEGTTCDPNPCPTPTEETTWGQIKTSYR